MHTDKTTGPQEPDVMGSQNNFTDEFLAKVSPDVTVWNISKMAIGTLCIILGIGYFFNYDKTL